MIKYEPYEPRGLILWRLKKIGVDDIWAIVLGIMVLVISSVGVYFWE